ncbi:MAG TPA: hypothetical protein VFX59_26635 [Polyangiales bacterium]|nr:hypothetical protein [Polyangiales bacterium]
MTLDPRDSELREGAPRSRKAFRFMPSAVLSHNLPVALENPNTVGRNLFARKLRESSVPPPRRDVLRWQTPLAYLIVAHGGGWTLTWHAPWCRRCDCAGAGWRFAFEHGYWAGLGFELSFPRPEV